MGYQFLRGARLGGRLCLDSCACGDRSWMLRGLEAHARGGFCRACGQTARRDELANRIRTLLVEGSPVTRVHPSAAGLSVPQNLKPRTYPSGKGRRLRPGSGAKPGVNSGELLGVTPFRFQPGRHAPIDATQLWNRLPPGSVAASVRSRSAKPRPTPIQARVSRSPGRRPETFELW